MLNERTELAMMIRDYDKVMATGEILDSLAREIYNDARERLIEIRSQGEHHDR